MKKMRKGKEKFTEDFFCVVLGRYRSGRVILYLTLLLINYTFLGKVLVGPGGGPRRGGGGGGLWWSTQAGSVAVQAFFLCWGLCGSKGRG
jgi:hypothetical protein